MTTDAELEDAKRRWGDHVEQVIGFPPVPEGVECPLRFGDVVRLKSGTVGVVTLPDLGGTMFAMLELDEAGRDLSEPDDPEAVQSTWDYVESVLASHGDLPEALQRHLEPLRKGIVLNETHWDQGVQFLEGEEYELFRQGDWSELSMGSERLVSEFFDEYSEAEGGAADRTRVLVHTDEDWSTWHCFGPMSAEEAEALIGRLDARFSRPTAIRRGVYEVGPETMTKYEVYRGYTRIEERHFCPGQGEAAAG